MKIIAAIAVGLALAGTLSTAPAQAQATRTFVSPTGSDASATCSLAAPCRTFAVAISKTNSGGEIDILGTAGYGSFTIDRAVSIVNPGGVEAGIAVASGGTGITINAGSGDRVSLRGLTVEGAGVGQNGIVLNSGGRLEIIDSVVRNFTADGILINPTSLGVTLQISNTYVFDTNSAGIHLKLQGSAQAGVTIDHVTVGNNNDGILMDTTNTSYGIDVLINNCTISDFASTGISAVASASAESMEVYIKDTAVRTPRYAGTVAISVSGGGSIVTLSHVMAAALTDIKMNGGTVFSAGNNDLSRTGNQVQGGTLTAAPEQ